MASRQVGRGLVRRAHTGRFPTPQQERVPDGIARLPGTVSRKPGMSELFL